MMLGGAGGIAFFSCDWEFYWGLCGMVEGPSCSGALCGAYQKPPLFFTIKYPNSYHFLYQTTPR